MSPRLTLIIWLEDFHIQCETEHFVTLWVRCLGKDPMGRGLIKVCPAARSDNFVTLHVQGETSEFSFCRRLYLLKPHREFINATSVNAIQK